MAVINGSEGNDTINGTGGDDIIYGAGGDDILDGGYGDDWLDGEGGKDALKAGLWFRRGRLVMVFHVPGIQAEVRQKFHLF